MGTVTNVTCCGIDVGRLISDLKQYNDPKETIKKAEAVFRCLMDGKNLTTCYFGMDNDFKQLQKCNECLHERGAIKCHGVLSCSGVFNTIANDIETMSDCPDLYPVFRPTTFDEKRNVLVTEFAKAHLGLDFDKASNMTKLLPKTEEDKNVDFASSIWANYIALTEAVKRERMEKYFTPKSIEWSADHRTVVVIWNDTEKTIVRLSPNDPDDIYMAFTAALAKRIFGTNSHIKKVIGRNLNEHKAKEKKAESARVVRRTDIGCSD